MHPGDLVGEFSDLEMTWLLYCAGAATVSDISYMTFVINSVFIKNNFRSERLAS